MEAGRWTGELRALFPVLAQDAYRAHGRWVSRVLRGGAHVQMCVNVDDAMRLELRIARREAPTSEAGWTKWNQEVATFREHLSPDLGRKWGLPVVEEVRGGVTATMIALFTGEVAKGKEACADCGKEIQFNPAYHPNRCEMCAMAAGRREAESIQPSLELPA